MYDLALIVAVIIALTELVKQVLPINKKFLPVISLMFGIIAGLVYVEGKLQERIFTGIVLGLTASGLFDQTKIVENND
ncbi:MAG TPA: hypothetical protein VK067_00180 [Pseudogracilibacillus sp.]|nr:hypothetical protein [Pseudogracilibacillus sp.]